MSDNEIKVVVELVPSIPRGAGVSETPLLGGNEPKADS